MLLPVVGTTTTNRTKMSGENESPFAMSGDTLLYAAIAAIISIVALLMFLDAMFRREAVKRELQERGCEPLHIRWRPLAYWAPHFQYHAVTPFRVIYLDTEKRLHKAYCYVDQDLFGSPFGRRRVNWVKDELRDFIDV